MGAETSIVGVSQAADARLRASRPVLGSRDGVERFLALHPDLILIRPMHARTHPGIWKSLKQQGVTVLAFQPNTLMEMYDYWHNLGILSGHEAESQSMISHFRTELKALKAQRPESKRPTVFFEAIHTRYRTFSPGSMPMLVLDAAGGKNVFPQAHARHGSNIADCGREQILSMGARIDVYLAQHGRMNPVSRETIMHEPGFEAIQAVRQGRVHLIDEHLVSRPTPSLLDAVRKVRELLFNH